MQKHTCNSHDKVEMVVVVFSQMVVEATYFLSKYCPAVSQSLQNITHIFPCGSDMLNVKSLTKLDCLNADTPFPHFILQIVCYKLQLTCNLNGIREIFMK